MEDPRTPSIVAQVVYKENSAGWPANYEKVKDDTKELLRLIKEMNELYQVPFNQPATRGGKAVGDPCKDCGQPMIQGKKGPYCKACYIAWKEAQG